MAGLTTIETIRKFRKKLLPFKRLELDLKPLKSGKFTKKNGS